MSIDTQYLILGLASGLLVLLARGFAPLGWCALAPLAVAMQGAAPREAAVAGALTGLALALGPLFRRFSSGMVLFTCTVTSATWAGLAVLASSLRPHGVVLLACVPLAALLSVLPLRLLGAPRWINNPLASTQEGASFVLHAAGRASDLAVTCALALSSACIASLWIEREAVHGLALLGVAAWLVYGRMRERAVQKQLDGAPTIRVAAVAADARGLANEEEPSRNVAAAVRRYEACMERAIEAGARIVVLPEVAVTLGPTTRDVWFAALTRWASHGRMLLIAGYYDEVSRQNLSVLVDALGRIVAEYEKQHPGPQESKRHQRTPPLHYHADGLPPVSSVTCVDLDYTDYFATVAQAGGVLLAPANDWPRLEELHHRTAIWAVTGTRVPLVRATGHGVSAVWDASGRVLARGSSLEGPVSLVVDLPVVMRPR